MSVVGIKKLLKYLGKKTVLRSRPALLNSSGAKTDKKCSKKAKGLRTKAPPARTLIYISEYFTTHIFKWHLDTQRSHMNLNIRVNRDS